MNEVSEGKMQLKVGISITSLEQLLQYLYTNQHDHIRDSESAFSILTHAEFFCLVEDRHLNLLTYCSWLILQQITSANCLEYLVGLPQDTTIYPIQNLRQSIIEFVVRNYSTVAQDSTTKLYHLPQIVFQEINVEFNLYLLKRLSQ